MCSKIFRKSNRLESKLYERAQIYFITICTDDKNTYCNDKGLVSYLIRKLENQSMQDRCKVLAYTFMPDHCHLLVYTEGNITIIDFIKKYKQITGYYFKQKYSKKLWQKSYYDHIVRDSEDIDEFIAYIFKNPVRSGLVDDWYEYPYSGSFEFEVKEIEL